MSTSTNISGLNLPAVAARRGNPLRLAPNLLTLLRIFLAPFLIVAVLDRRFELALRFSGRGLHRCHGRIAGPLARQRTMLGQYLDPVADKLMLSSLFLVLTWMGILEPRVAILVFGRDIGMLLTAVILYATTNLRDFHPSLLGKANSFSQVVAIGMVLAGPDLPAPVGQRCPHGHAGRHHLSDRRVRLSLCLGCLAADWPTPIIADPGQANRRWLISAA
jgi:cardiolipin synthase